MSDRRGVLGGLAGLGIFGPKVVKEAAARPLIAGQQLRGIPGRLGMGGITGIESIQCRGQDFGGYSEAMDAALNTPLVQSLFSQNHALRDLINDLGEAPCVMGHKSNAPWFRRMATRRAIEKHSNMIDRVVEGLMGERFK